MPIDVIRKLFGLSGRSETPDPATQADSIRRIAQALDELEPQTARFIAAFAYLLGRVARADLHVSSEETATMEAIVRSQAGLPEDQATLIVEMAKHQNRLFGGIEDFLVTREFGRAASPAQKLTLLDCLFAVAASERLVSVIEENEIRQIARELQIEHSDYILVRSRHRSKLAVLHPEGDSLAEDVAREGQAAPKDPPPSSPGSF